MQTKQIPGWVPAVVRTLTEVIKAEFVPKIGDEDIRLTVAFALDAVYSTAEVLADDDPNDSSQVNKVWLAFVNGPVTTLVDAEITQAIERIPNDTIRVPLQTLKVPVVDMLRIITDEDPNNSAQLEVRWRLFVKDPETQKVFFSLVDQLIQANLSGAARTIAIALWATLKQIIADKIDDLVK